MPLATLILVYYTMYIPKLLRLLDNVGYHAAPIYFHVYLMNCISLPWCCISHDTSSICGYKFVMREYESLQPLILGILKADIAQCITYYYRPGSCIMCMPRQCVGYIITPFLWGVTGQNRYQTIQFEVKISRNTCFPFAITVAILLVHTISIILILHTP